MLDQHGLARQNTPALQANIHLCDPGSIPVLTVSSRLILLLVLALLLPSTKTNASKFQFDMDVERLKHESPARETGRPLPTVFNVK